MSSGEWRPQTCIGCLKRMGVSKFDKCQQCRKRPCAGCGKPYSGLPLRCYDCRRRNTNDAALMTDGGVREGTRYREGEQD